MAEVSIENAVKTYAGGVQAVDDCSLAVADGELLVLVGPSGCGKSTLLRMIAGLEEITSGTIRIGSVVVNRVEPKDRNVAFVFQSYALYPHMTVYENIAFPLRNAKVPRAEVAKQVEAAAEMLGITPYLGRKPAEISGGQRQRVALGRALVRRPEVFLLDEPLSNLDAKLRTATRKEILLLHRKLGRTMIYVTHDQTEAMTLGDRICVLKDGRIQQIGRPLDVYHRPANLFVAGFMGSAPMNLVEGSLEEGPRGPVFRSALIDIPLGSRWRGSARDAEGGVTAGIRPEDLLLRPEGSESGMRAQVVFTERLGDTQLVYLRAGDQELTFKTDANLALADGALCGLDVRLESVQVFSRKTGLNLVQSPLGVGVGADSAST